MAPVKEYQVSIKTCDWSSQKIKGRFVVDKGKKKASVSSVGGFYRDELERLYGNEENIILYRKEQQDWSEKTTLRGMLRLMKKYPLADVFISQQCSQKKVITILCIR